MPANAQAPPAPAAASFANLLAGLTTPRQQADSFWNDSALADDIATISYEQALRAHARYRPASSREQHPSTPSPVVSTAEDSAPPRKPPMVERSPLRSTSFESPPPTLAESRKSASVTIRLSGAECKQLHKRATEAGLTVSAYLRSCIFEVETLRTQVKGALSQLRSVSVREAQPPPASPLPIRTVLFGWLSRILARLHRGQRLANA